MKFWSEFCAVFRAGPIYPRGRICYNNKEEKDGRAVQENARAGGGRGGRNQRR